MNKVKEINIAFMRDTSLNLHNRFPIRLTEHKEMHYETVLDRNSLIT